MRLSAVVLAIALSSCGGLDPDTLPQVAELYGSVHYVNGEQQWQDSIVEVRVVLFDQKPLAPDSVLSAILNGKAAYTDTLPRFVDSCSYSITIAQPPHTYRYIVVAGRTGPNFIKDWKMLSLFHTPDDPNSAETLFVEEGAKARVDFVVDFNNLPPQPF